MIVRTKSAFQAFSWVLVGSAVACARPEPSTQEPPRATPHSLTSAEAKPTTSQASLPLKIATWNIEWLHQNPGQGQLKRQGRDYEGLRRYAKQLDADLVALQEVNGAEAARQVFDDREYAFHFAANRNIQNTGFAYRKHLSVTLYPDVEDLNLEGTLRSGVDLALHFDGFSLRVLSVHLKSGCFFESLSTKDRACGKLLTQLPILERWIDARASENQPFLVLGDFNRRLGPKDSFWQEIDDSSPANADLVLATADLSSRCAGAKHPELIDHIVFSRDAARLLVPGTVQQLLFGTRDKALLLSDHCPIAAQLRVPPSAPQREATPASVEPATNPSPAGQNIKGNINSAHRKLYHLPSCPSYDSTVIDPNQGERYFGTEAEAIAAGWVKAGSCP